MLFGVQSQNLSKFANFEQKLAPITTNSNLVVDSYVRFCDYFLRFLRISFSFSLEALKVRLDINKYLCIYVCL